MPGGGAALLSALGREAHAENDIAERLKDEPGTQMMM